MLEQMNGLNQVIYYMASLLWEIESDTQDRLKFFQRDFILGKKFISKHLQLPNVDSCPLNRSQPKINF